VENTTANLPLSSTTAAFSTYNVLPSTTTETFHTTNIVFSTGADSFRTFTKWHTNGTKKKIKKPVTETIH
jgi:nicotinic acid mononucleotide adenylyltransferase